MKITKELAKDSLKWIGYFFFVTGSYEFNPLIGMLVAGCIIYLDVLK